MWFENIKKITKKFGVAQSDIIFARDGKDVWRYKIYPEYKATRSGPLDTDLHAPGPVFKHINETFHKVLGAKVLKVERAEADDIAAVATRYIRAAYPDKKVIIITGDYDFLQLSEEGKVELYQLKGWKRITSNDPHAALMLKILAGDPSDNIPGVFKGCGKKTAQRLAQDPNALEEVLKKHGVEQYQLNQTLIDFDCIPVDLVEEIEALLDECL